MFCVSRRTKKILFCLLALSSFLSLAILGKRINAQTEIEKPLPIIYYHYDWQNQDFRQTAPKLGPVGSQLDIAWSDIHTGDGVFNWTPIDNYLQQIHGQNMKVKIENREYYKPVILNIFM